MARKQIGVTDAIFAGWSGPWVDSNNNVYVLTQELTSFVTQIHKAGADPLVDTWTVQDDAGRPWDTVAGAPGAGWQDGTKIHVVQWEPDFRRYEYSVFGTSDDANADQWDGTIINEVVEGPANEPIAVAGFIAVRSDGDVIVLYNGDTDKIMGTDYDRCDYARREGGTWTAGINVSGDGLEASHLATGIGRGLSDGMWLQYTKAAAGGFTKNLSSSNSLGAEVTISASGTEWAHRLPYYNDTRSVRFSTSSTADYGSAQTWIEDQRLIAGDFEIDWQQPNPFNSALAGVVDESKTSVSAYTDFEYAWLRANATTIWIYGPTFAESKSVTEVAGEVITMRRVGSTIDLLRNRVPIAATAKTVTATVHPAISFFDNAAIVRCSHVAGQQAQANSLGSNLTRTTESIATVFTGWHAAGTDVDSGQLRANQFVGKHDLSGTDFESSASEITLVLDGFDVYAVYRSGTDDDVLYQKWQLGGAWGSITNLSTATAPTKISANVIDHGGGKVLAVVYDDGDVYYDEISIAVVASGSPQIPNRKHIHLLRR